MGSGKLGYNILHRSTPECPAERTIRLRESMGRTQDIVVSDTDVKPCMKSGETPRKRETNYEENSAELSSLYLRGVCGEVCYVEDYAWVDGKRSARNGAMRGSTSPIRISRASRRPISGPSVTPLCVTAS